MHRVWVGLVLLFPFTTGLALPKSQDAWAARARTQLERLLHENIVPFWMAEVVDREAGGYRLNHGPDGTWRGPSPRALVTQARTLWFFSALVNHGSAKKEYLEAAEHGYRFLAEKMWDHQHGGFFWEVSYAGDQPTKADKHLYGNAFGLYALAEYAMASGDRSALRLGEELFALLEKHAHDSQFGGYHEFFRRDWSPSPADATGYLGVSPEIKLMNTHLHLMEAFTTFYEATRDARVKDRLTELILIQSSAVVRKEPDVCTDRFGRDWTPLTGPEYDRVSYGHDLENVWLLDDACRAAGLPSAPLLGLFRSLVDSSLRYGFDWDQGGFFYSGPFAAAADDRHKSWWVQAESLVGLLRMYLLSGEERYRRAFELTLDWVIRSQADWENGDWHAMVDEGKIPSGEKAGVWKSPYHNGRAMLECLRMLNTLTQMGR